MAHRFVFATDASGVTLRLVGPQGGVDSDRWAVEAPDPLLPAVDLLRRLESTGAALIEGDWALIDHAAVAALSPHEASSLGLPPLADATVRLTGEGLITQPNFKVRLEWLTPLGAPLLGASRAGALLTAGGVTRRLPETLLAVAEAVEKVNAAPRDDRLGAISELRGLLPSGAEEGVVTTSGLLGAITIAVADAFSLDLVGHGADALLAPVLHRAQGDADAPLLPPAQQTLFAERHFNAFKDARAVYPLGANWYVVLQPPLRRALSLVRRANGAPPSTRRAFLANPRLYLREALADDLDDVVMENLFRETRGYSERVVGLGLWTPRVLPWVRIEATDWLDEGAARSGGGGVKPPRGGLTIEGRRIDLTPDEAATLRRDVEDAMGAGRASVDVRVGAETVRVPAEPQTIAALEELERARRVEPDAAPPVEKPAAAKVLLIAPNEDGLDHQGYVKPPRPASPPGVPASLGATLLPHQREGLDWLQHSWIKGSPGVLLADDMGLGKTVQSLAFLVWLRDSMRAGLTAKAPILIVAPTGLLQNWREEHDRHLVAPGLGVCVDAYGRGLAALKTREGGEPGLDFDRLAAADWILTTYETLRDHHLSFGRIRFAALLFDEAQKIKTPGVRLTDAAKAMQAEFVISLTGTPVENRLADLWCVVDTVQPGWLGDLKSFSALYERDLDVEKLGELKRQLEHAYGGRPQLMLRRMKEDRLPDLPVATWRPSPRAMPPVQQSAYDEVMRSARDDSDPGAMLKALQALRSISLHPTPDAAVDDDAFIAASARLSAAFEALDEIAAKGEKALIFVGDLGMQARLRGLLQRRYGLARPPTLISGSVPGAKRQALVNQFQREAAGFRAMILSPRAAGVGLTLTQANHVIHLSRWWNPAVEDQCTGRALRIGQKLPVTIHLPLSTCRDGRRSFDENLDMLLERKRKLMRETLAPPDATQNADRDELFDRTFNAA